MTGYEGKARHLFCEEVSSSNRKNRGFQHALELELVKQPSRRASSITALPNDRTGSERQKSSR